VLTDYCSCLLLNTVCRCSANTDLTDRHFHPRLRVRVADVRACRRWIEMSFWMTLFSPRAHTAFVTGDKTWNDWHQLQVIVIIIIIMPIALAPVTHGIGVSLSRNDSELLKKTIRYNRPTLPCIIYKSDGQSVELSHVTKTQNYKETKQTYKIDEQ